jgi:hypothetical protein
VMFAQTMITTTWEGRLGQSTGQNSNREIVSTRVDN